jgi:hypothetical protein
MESKKILLEIFHPFVNSATLIFLIPRGFFRVFNNDENYFLFSNVGAG